MLRACLLASLLGLIPSVFAQDTFAVHGPYDPAIPRPDKVLGYALGSRITTYQQQQTYLEALAKAAPDRVKVVPYGFTWEKRPLRIAVIGTPDQISNLGTLQARYKKLADADPAETGKDLPALVWINQTIHGNEAASFESSMWLMYNLVASRSERFETMRKKSMVIVNPCYNPDGHERFAVWYNSVAVGTDEPGAFEHDEPRIIHGRTNHYRFDMNRDRVSFSQVETQQEVAEYMRWMPHVYVDQHGEVETYFFPPNPMSVNPFVDRDRLNKWTDHFGRASAKAFDARGWSYYIKDVYDFYYAGYLDSFTGLAGAIGMTHETDMAEIRRRNPDGSMRTLEAAMDKHFTAAIAVIEESANRRDELIGDFAKFRKAQATGERLAKDQRYFVAVTPTESIAQSLYLNLSRMGVEAEIAPGQISSRAARSLWTGKTEEVKRDGWSVMVKMAQPNGAIARAMLDPKQDFEPEFIEAQKRNLEAGRGTEFYDMTGWSLPFMYGVEAWWCENEPNFEASSGRKPAMGTSSVGYALVPGEQSARQLFDLMAAGYRVKIGPEPMKVGELELPANTAFILAMPNDKAKFAELAGTPGLIPLPTQYPARERYGPGSENMLDLRGAPKVGVVFGSADNPTSYNGIWFAMEQELKIPFVPMTWNQFNSAKLDSYSCLILPSGRYPAVPERLKQWVQDGGCLVILGGRFGVGSLVTMDSVSTPSVPGAIGVAELGESWLTAGMSGPIAVPIDGGTFYKANENTALRATGTIVAGWKWDGTERAIKDTAFAQVEESGRGHVVYFAQDPTERAMFRGLWPMLLNAIIMGPRR